jgi:hypothetical protein
MEQDIQQLVNRSIELLSLETAQDRDSTPYQSLGQCVLDAVYSINARYLTVRKVVQSYCQEFGVQERRKHRDRVPSIESQCSVDEFLRHLNSYGPQNLATEVFDNRSKVRWKLKSQIAIEFAQVLSNHNVGYWQDVHRVSCLNACEEDILKVYGIGEPTWKYFLMLCRLDDFCKPDRMLRRFVGGPGGCMVAAREAEWLITKAHSILVSSYPTLTLRLLDHEIWLYERARQNDTQAKVKGYMRNQNEWSPLR